MPYGNDPSTSSAHALTVLRRERDSAQRNCEFWKKQALGNMAKEHADGFTAGIIVTSAVYGVVFVVVALIATS